MVAYRNHLVCKAGQSDVRYDFDVSTAYNLLTSLEACEDNIDSPTPQYVNGDDCTTCNECRVLEVPQLYCSGGSTSLHFFASACNQNQGGRVSGSGSHSFSGFSRIK